MLCEEKLMGALLTHADVLQAVSRFVQFDLYPVTIPGAAGVPASLVAPPESDEPPPCVA